MARMRVESESLTGVADKIREKTAATEALAFPEGFEAGVERVFSAGEKSEYDRFWDCFQKSGTRTDYTYGFAGYGWHEKTFAPKYNIRPTKATRMFYYFGQMQFTSTIKRSDLVELLSNCGVTLDFSRCTTMYGAFEYAMLTRVGEISTLGLSTLERVFQNATSLITVEQLILKSNGSQSFDRTFYNAKKLENLAVYGVIGKGGFNVQWSTNLSQASIMSIIDALSPETSGLAVTFSKAAVDKAFESSQGAADGSSWLMWPDIIAPKSNWTFNLV